MMMHDLQDRLNQYVTDLFAPEDDVLRQIQAEADRQELPAISIEPFDGRLLQVLMAAVGAKKVVEVGTLAGYSGVWLARALPPDGKLFTLEKSSKHAAVAQRHFEAAGVADRVEILQGEAVESLRKLSAQQPFDFMFIDADKAGYPLYLDWAAENLRPGGMFTAHNGLFHGKVIAPDDDNSRAVASFNAALARDSRFESTVIAVGDGMIVGVRKA
jgi:caffeoyl-CoA O-methyltransferase